MPSFGTHAGRYCPAQSDTVLINAAEHIPDIRGTALGCTGRGRRPEIGRKIGNRKIGFMTHAGNQRGIQRINGSGQGFVIEGPEILNRTPAAHQQQ